jgi:hypothetical protein
MAYITGTNKVMFSAMCAHVCLSSESGSMANIAALRICATNRPLPSHISLHCGPIVTPSIDPSQQSTPWALLLDSRRYPHRKALHARNEEMTYGQ